MRLLDQVREVIRKKHYSIRTEQAYVQWLPRQKGSKVQGVRRKA